MTRRSRNHHRAGAIGFALVSCLLVPLTAAAEAKGNGPTLQLGSDVWPPFTDGTGKSRLALDLTDEALRRSGHESRTKIRPWGEIISALREGKLDGSAAIWRSAEREAYLLYSRPYLENRLVLVGRKGEDTGASSLSSLAGKRVALVEAYAYGDLARGADGVKLVEGTSDQANLEKLLRGDVDYMLVDDLLIRYVLSYQREEAAAVLSVGTRTLATRTLHFALRKDLPGAEAVIADFDREIKKMQVDGTYNRILQLDWIRADVDGDGTPEFVLRGKNAGTEAPSQAYSITVEGSADEPGPGIGGFFVDNKVYKSWDAVPPQYKRPGELNYISGSRINNSKQSARVFQFRF